MTNTTETAGVILAEDTARGLLTPPGAQIMLDGHGGWWAPPGCDDETLPPDPTLGVGIEVQCLADCPYEPEEGSHCTAARHSLGQPHVAGDGEHVLAVWWEPKVWACPEPGCGYHIADGPVPDGEQPATWELIQAHCEEHEHDRKQEREPAAAAAVTPSSVAPETAERGAFTAGLREPADWLDTHPQVPLPYLGRGVPGCDLQSMPIYLHAPCEWQTDKPDVRTQMAVVARAMGRADKATRTYSSGEESFLVWRTFGGVAVYAEAERDEVCQRVVLGTREVTEEVPDPQLLAAVPKITVTRTVEDVKWVCGSVLAGEAGAAA